MNENKTYSYEFLPESEIVTHKYPSSTIISGSYLGMQDPVYLPFKKCRITITIKEVWVYRKGIIVVEAIFDILVTTSSGKRLFKGADPESVQVLGDVLFESHKAMHTYAIKNPYLKTFPKIPFEECVKDARSLLRSRVELGN